MTGLQDSRIHNDEMIIESLCCMMHALTNEVE